MCCAWPSTRSCLWNLIRLPRQIIRVHHQHYYLHRFCHQHLEEGIDCGEIGCHCSWRNNGRSLIYTKEPFRAQALSITMEKQNEQVPIVDVSKGVLLLHTILPGIVAIFVALRLYSRYCYLCSPGWDDRFLVCGFVWLSIIFSLSWRRHIMVNKLTQVMIVAFEALICSQTKFGLGKHIWDIDPKLVKGFSKVHLYNVIAQHWFKLLTRI